MGRSRVNAYAAFALLAAVLGFAEDGPRPDLLIDSGVHFGSPDTRGSCPKAFGLDLATFRVITGAR
jgi:hypothetical protein